MIREDCHNHVVKPFSSTTSKQSTNIKAGNRIHVSHEDHVDFMKNNHVKINPINRKIVGFVKIQLCNSVLGWV